MGAERANGSLPVVAGGATPAGTRDDATSASGEGIKTQGEAAAVSRATSRESSDRGEARAAITIWPAGTSPAYHPHVLDPPRRLFYLSPFSEPMGSSLEGTPEGGNSSDKSDVIMVTSVSEGNRVRGREGEKDGERVRESGGVSAASSPRERVGVKKMRGGTGSLRERLLLIGASWHQGSGSNSQRSREVNGSGHSAGSDCAKAEEGRLSMQEITDSEDSEEEDDDDSDDDEDDQVRADVMLQTLDLPVW